MELNTKVPFDRLFKELVDEEGLKLKAYKDTVGVVTIGIGHNLQANPAKPLIGRNVYMGGSITMDEAKKLFAHDIESVIDDLDERLPWFKDLSLARQYVLISMGFNLGVPGLMKWKNTLSALKSGDIKGTVTGMLNSKWASQVGRRSKKLCEIMAYDSFADER